MLTVFWDMKEPITINFLEKSATVQLPILQIKFILFIKWLLFIGMLSVMLILIGIEIGNSSLNPG